MKIINRDEMGIVFQGDIAITKTSEMPSNLTESETNIVALSETHHHHVAECAKVYAAPDGMTLYMQAIGQSIDIVHKRSYDTHETIRFLTKPGDVFKVRRQREFAPEGWRRVED